ncbi:ImmA/IrrE family metallo-endopeptidase [Paenibacillus sp. alder61]|uniref:ImmA/IrrE family metallo-endopeptidase n=1 Tax=Paenibacillus faecis TaxID=862114 RepID=A0A5D0CT11_9BACL|nr:MULTISPECIES: ImmA/IrrE family metallo-endopeptidase [Paenibacillus]MCA1293692.1 ImmA/IrrE family metallo-endopeptidase [Paenibacillus sp. alder61]TYA12800.1 ImmA/IrrE family metallo-endopeptidase [Paenibacillus faecis]
MLFSYYRETELEQWISGKYLAHGILGPAEHDIEHIAYAFGVDLVYEECPSFSDNEERVIFLNKHADDVTARVIFFHELCHVLRHAGDQRIMPAMFRSAQETEAEQFVLYAAIPFYMFTRLPVPDQRSEAVAYLAETFRVPYGLAEHRLDQIQRRVLHGSLIAAAKEADRQRQSACGWSGETKRIMAQLERQLGGNPGGN